MADRVFGGRYRVTGTLGHGGMASVYRAVDEQLGREVAVKVFRIGAVDNGERARAEAEIHTLAALRSPSLVTLYDAALDDVDGDSYLVMELVPGSDLDTRLREGPLDTTTTARVGAQVAEGLAAVHAQGIVHRDVKPANVLLESDGEHVKLADFGIALLRDAARVTGTGTVIGTAAYISPEQVLGREVTGQADVYALGLVLLQCLTGERPFPGSAVESATARLTRDPEIDQHLPTAWRTLLHVMTAQDPGERPTAAEAARRLRALERDGTAPATQLLPGSPGSLTRAAGGAAGAAAGVAGAALGAGGPDAAHADQATQAMPTAADSDDGADAATRAYDRTAPFAQPGAGSGGQDDVATTVLGAQRGGGAAGAAAGGGAAIGGAAAGGAAARGAGGAGRAGADTDESKRRRGPIIAAVVVALLVLAGIGVALFALDRGDETPAPTGTSEPSTPTDEQSGETEQQPSEPAEEPSEPAQEPSQEQQPSEPAQEPSQPAEEPSQPADDPSVGPQPGGPASNPVEAPQGGNGNGNGNGPGSNSGKGKGAGTTDTTVDTTVGSLTEGPAKGPGRG